MTDVKVFAELYHAMDWEGGLEGIVRHGFNTSGDDELDVILDQLEVLIEKADARIRKLMGAHGDDVEEFGDNL